MAGLPDFSSFVFYFLSWDSLEAERKRLYSGACDLLKASQGREMKQAHRARAAAEQGCVSAGLIPGELGRVNCPTGLVSS